MRVPSGEKGRGTFYPATVPNVLRNDTGPTVTRKKVGTGGLGFLDGIDGLNRL